MNALEVVKDVYGEWERGNYRAGLELYDPGLKVEIHSPIPEAGVYEGLDGLQRYLRNFLGTWEEYEMRMVGIEQESGRVVVQIHHGGRASGAWVETDYFAVWSFRGDRAVRIDFAQDQDTALAAARGVGA
jgi:ketosteroid isomerase-like protein